MSVATTFKHIILKQTQNTSYNIPHVSEELEIEKISVEKFDISYITWVLALRISCSITK